MTGSTGHPRDSLVATTADARLSLKPLEKTSGYVDGAWWPGSLDLAAEIPSLVKQLSGRWGAVDRVSYDVAAWTPTARQITAGGRRIRLDGFRGRRPTDAVHVMGGGRPALTLLIIPPTAPAGEAAATLRRAGSRGNQETIDDLLHRSTRGGHPELDPPTDENLGAHTGTGRDADLGRWDSEGGRASRPTD